MDAPISTKINTYNEFIESKLKEDLKAIEVKLERLHEEKQHWRDAKLNFKMLRTFREKCPGNDLELHVPLAEWEERAIVASATVTDLSCVHVVIGCGVRLPMELDEADKYADIRIKALERQIAHYMNLAVEVKVHIKVTLLAINELMVGTSSDTKQVHSSTR